MMDILQAPSEAEAQCAELARGGKVNSDSVPSETALYGSYL